MSKRDNRCGEHSRLLNEERRREWERRESKAKGETFHFYMKNSASTQSSTRYALLKEK